MRAIRSIKYLLIAFLISIVPASAFAGVFVSITVAPPVLPVYAQPVCPTPGYLWTPGYWAYGPAGYYWVPGVWVAPPRPGLLWTPGYWGFGGGIYAWHAGFWGPTVGFYGGVNYGFGYPGVGFIGGRWQGGSFFYNSAVLHVNTTVIHNTYIDRTVIHNTTIVNRTSFNGPGGLGARPNAQEAAAMRAQHFQATAAQASHERFAANDRSNLASVNGGHPGNPAMSHPMGAPNGNRGAYNNAANRPAYNGANNHPTNNNANYHQPANNQQHANDAQHNYGQQQQQHGGEQPHEQPHEGNHGGEHPR
jgi:hypothetical protein